PGVSNQLHGVTCSNATDCWAVGTSHAGNLSAFFQTFIVHWDGTSWSVTPSPNTGSTLENGLNSVTCTSSTNCWATGYGRTSATNQPAQTMIQHWDGNTWSIVPAPDVTTAADNILTAVTCSGANDCWSVGYYDSGAVDA